VLDALAAEGPVSSPDMLDEDRWPEYAQAALARGTSQRDISHSLPAGRQILRTGQ
jgi:hypothetical protein